MKDLNVKTLESIVRRAHYLANNMIYVANNRKDKDKGDPKVGGHSSATSSSIHIMGAIHLVLKSGFDHVANKPHASPADHSFSYLLDLLLDKELNRLSQEECDKAMEGLRAFPQGDEHVFQSYHSAYDPDHFNFFPSGTVGIPPVVAGYLAHAYRFAKTQGFEVPKAHFWCVMGDSEFREGSLLEAAPDLAEREVGNLTWIVDYNRQSLDGNRITNPEIMGGADNERIDKTMAANGWDVIQVRHGKKRMSLFEKGQEFKNWLEKELPDFELQSLLLVTDPEKLHQFVKENHPSMKSFLEKVSAQEFFEALRDFGGHDMEVLVEALESSQKNPDKPCMVIVHTIKGWGLEMAAVSGNHNTLVQESELQKIRKEQGLSEDTLFARFEEGTDEGQFLRKRGDELLAEFKEQEAIKKRNYEKTLDTINDNGGLPETLNVNLKMASYPHTQWMLGQLAAKMNRIANTPLDEKKLAEKQKPLKEDEIPWKKPSELIVEMAPDVGTSTNLNPTMDGQIFGANETEDFETELGVKDKKTPDLVPGTEKNDRFFRFEIEEASNMSCAGAYGQLINTLGIPILPLMTIYDFFIKRALDQYFYNCYWKSSFIVVGTPSGVTLSPEGAQHCWKSDFQVPGQITWEPFFCQEMDWILCESIRRHMTGDNKNRNAVLIRNVTRGVEQKDLLKSLKTQHRFKSSLSENQLLTPKGFEIEGAIEESQVDSVSDQEILSSLKEDVLQGGYRLIDYRGYAGYEPGDNVVNIFAMGALGREALQASNELLSLGIYANVIIVTSSDLLVGSLGRENNFQHLREGLGINADLHLQPQLNGNLQASELVTVAGRRIPCVSVHDGEPGLLDNIGSIIGVRHESLAVRQHSRCGRPREVYGFHGIDTESIKEACAQVLSETAMEHVQISRRALQDSEYVEAPQGDWRQLWPNIQKQ